MLSKMVYRLVALPVRAKTPLVPRALAGLGPPVSQAPLGMIPALLALFSAASERELHA
jgi:hypothetical protein